MSRLKLAQDDAGLCNLTWEASCCVSFGACAGTLLTIGSACTACRCMVQTWVGIGTSMCMWAKFCSACAGIAHRQLLAQSRQLCLDMRLGPRWSLSWRERRLGERPRCNSYVADAMLLPCGSARRLEVAASWLELPDQSGECGYLCWVWDLPWYLACLPPDLVLWHA